MAYVESCCVTVEVLFWVLDTELWLLDWIEDFSYLPFTMFYFGYYSIYPVENIFLNVIKALPFSDIAFPRCYIM